MNVLQTCHKSRICPCEQFLIQQKGFFDRCKYENPIQMCDQLLLVASTTKIAKKQTCLNANLSV